MSTKKQYTVILPDVIKARSEQAAWDAFLEYIGECHLMGDVTCFDVVEVKPLSTKQQQHKTNSNMIEDVLFSEHMTPKQMRAIRCAYADLQGSAQARLIQGGTHDWKAHNQSIADLEREFPFLVDRLLRKEVTEGHIFKAAGLYLCGWPDEWTEVELLAALRNEDHESITVCEAHEMQPMEDIAKWIEDAARTFS
jgi:hypothetical protein